jgi:hypothetical protein
MFGIGLPEAVALLAVVLAVIFVPRMRGAGSESRRQAAPISGKTRLFIVFSGVWLLGAAALTKPWEGSWGLFVYGGAGPLVILWGALWVISGFSGSGRGPTNRPGPG